MKRSRRAQTVLACQRCRQSKLGCDKQRPSCGRCVNAGVFCKYLCNRSEQAESYISPVPSQEEGDRTVQDNEHEGEELPTSRIKATVDKNSRPVQRRRRVAVSCIRCRRSKVLCDRKRPCGRCAKSKSDCAYERVQNGIYRYDKQALGESNIKKLDFEALHAQWKAKYRTDIHWVSLSRDVSRKQPTFPQLLQTDPLFKIENLLSSHGHGHSEGPQPEQYLPLSTNYPFGYVNVTTALMSIIPARPVVEMFIHTYYNTIEKTHRLLHIPTFEAEVKHFWERPTAMEDSWLSQFFVILGLGCQIYNLTCTPDEAEIYKALPDRFLEAAQVFLQRTPFLCRPDLANIRTLCLMVLAKQVNRMSCDESDACWCLTGIIVRLAMSIGLHSDTTGNKDLSPLEAEMRRILWTTIAYLDLRQCLASGMPLLLRPDDFTCSGPANINHNGFFGDEGYLDLTPRDLSERTESTFHVIFWHAFPLMSKVVNLIHSPLVHPDNDANYELVLSYDSQIRQLLKQANFILGGVTAESQQLLPQSEPHRLQRIMFDIVLRQLQLALHRRFAHEPLASIKYPVSYWTSLDCSIALLLHQGELCSEVEIESESESPGEISFVSQGQGQRQNTRWLASLFWPNFLTAALTVSLFLVRSDSLLEPPTRIQHTVVHPRETVLEALRSCRDIWSEGKDVNVCHTKAYAFIDHVVAVLDEAWYTVSQQL